jgi:phage replication initiation protein
VIPWDALTRCNEYFVGAYPALARVAAASGERIRTTRSNIDVNVARIVRGVKASYGKWLNVFAEAGVSPKQIMRACGEGGRPGKLSGALSASSVFADTIKSAFGVGAPNASFG